jgi:hypothetical protein
MSTKLNVFFPIANLNPQGWISEFITPVLIKTDKNRDILSNLFYNSTFEESDPIQRELLGNLRAAFGSGDSYTKFINERAKVGRENEEKMAFLNGNLLDLFEVDETLKGPQVTDEELQKYIKFMTTAKPYELSFLQPYLKLSYGYRENGKQEFTWIDFPFTQKYDLDYILSERTHGRVEGSGITNVTVENKFNLATQINSQANISYTFGSMKILTQELNSNGTKAEGKSDLPYGFSFTKLIANLNFTKEAIRLEYGKKVSDGLEKISGNQEIKSIIERREKKVILLSKFRHSFKFDNNGVITLTGEYYNFHDASMYSVNNISIPSYTPRNIQKLNLKKDYGDMLVKYNVLKNEIDLLENQLLEVKKSEESKKIDKFESEQKSARVKDITAKLSQSNKTINLLKRSLKQDLTTVLLDQIKTQGQLFSVNFNTFKDENSFKIDTTINLIHPSNGDFLPVVKVPQEAYNTDSLRSNPSLKDWVEKTGELKTLSKMFAKIFNSPYNEKAVTSKYGNIMFFPLKALFSAAYSFLDDKTNELGQSEKEKIPYMLFGNVLMKIGDKYCSINIGDLLIESGTFQKWYYEKFYKKDRMEYSFGALISDIITDLVPEALYRNRVGFDDKAPTSAIKQTQFYLINKIDEELKQKLYMSGDVDNLKKLSSLISKNPSSSPKPLIYYGQLNNKSTQVPSPIFSKYGNSKFDFKEEDDSKIGIMHIKIGSDGGIVTDVGFVAQDFSKIRTALALESLADKSSRYFFFYYQLDIEMLGNNLFGYDAMVCVPSNPLGIDTEINDPGIAGYYKVKETKDTFDMNNQYTTTAVADWIFSPKNGSEERASIAVTPSVQVKIYDHLPHSINDPIKYLVQVIENDPISVINSQLQNFTEVKKTTSEKAKKDKTLAASPTKLDRQENLQNKKTPIIEGN